MLMKVYYLEMVAAEMYNLKKNRFIHKTIIYVHPYGERMEEVPRNIEKLTSPAVTSVTLRCLIR